MPPGSGTGSSCTIRNDPEASLSRSLVRVTLSPGRGIRLQGFFVEASLVRGIAPQPGDVGLPRVHDVTQAARAGKTLGVAKEPGLLVEVAVEDALEAREELGRRPRRLERMPLQLPAQPLVVRADAAEG